MTLWTNSKIQDPKFEECHVFYQDIASPGRITFCQLRAFRRFGPSRIVESGKHKKGGLHHLVCNRWCNPSQIMIKNCICFPDTELFAIEHWLPYCSPKRRRLWTWQQLKVHATSLLPPSLGISDHILRSHAWWGDCWRNLMRPFCFEATDGQALWEPHEGDLLALSAFQITSASLWTSLSQQGLLIVH